jgi:flagellar hook-length control protein FliK
MRPIESITAAATGADRLRTPVAERNSQGGFELIFADAQRRETTRTQEITRDERPLREQRQEQPRSENRTEQPQRTRRRDESAPAEQPVANESVTETPDAAYAYGETRVTCASDEEIVVTVAEILQITPEALQALLAELGLSPQDLTEPQAVTQLLQAALEVETPAALLAEPTFPATYKAINEAMASMKQTASATTTATAQTASAYNVDLASVPLLEGVQIVKEGEQLIVTDVPQVEETTTTRPTTARTSASTTTETTTAPAETTEPAAPLLTEEIAVEQQPTMNAAPLTQMVSARVQVAHQAVAQTPQYVNPADVLNQVMDQIRAHTGEQVTEMKLTLRPESLGDIVLRVLTQNGIVTAQFIAENERVREALESNFNQLRDALQEQGIRFAELSVSVAHDGNDQMNQFEQGRQATRERAQRIAGTMEEEAPVLGALHDFDNTIDVTA